MQTYGRGSEWRRWDLHVHTPGTALEDQFGSWDDYVGAVEAADAAVAVMGVTDYVTLRSYKKFLEFRGKKRMRNIILALPNLEFRISPETRKGKAINIHLLISPERDDHVSRIEEALSRLSLTRGGENIPCTEKGLIRLGKLTDSNQSSEPAALIEGIRQFKVEFDQFREWFQNEQWLSRNSLVAVAGGSTDGASGLVDSGFLATRRELFAFADIIFSGNPNDREAWLGRGSIPKSELAALRGPKPVAHGSDAHGVERLFKPQLDRFCWIKADPTFEGLRQILYEPEDRIWIGDTPPTTHESRSVIDSISLVNTNGWFDEFTLPLNSGLAAIIGLKGSGKTALADLIASTSRASLDPDNSFISRASEHIAGLHTLLLWKDESVTESIVGDEGGEDTSSTVKYLTQHFVDRLCSGGNALSDELLQEIESVVFDHLPLEDRMEAEDFSALRAIRIQGLQEARNETRNEISTLNREIADLNLRRSQILKKSARRAELPKLRENLKKVLPKINDETTSKKLEELQKLRDQKNKVSRSIAELKATKQQIQDLERRFASKVRDFQAFWRESENTLRKLGFEEEALKELRPDVPSGPGELGLSKPAAAAFKTRYTEIDKEMEKLESAGTSSGPKAAPPSSAAALDMAIASVEQELKLDEAKKRKLLEIQRQERALAEEQRKLESEFNWVQNTFLSNRQALQARRMESYLMYFQFLDEERRILEGLYAPLKEALSKQGTHEQKLEMVCRIAVDTAGWIARGEELFDLRKSGAFRFDDLRSRADELDKAWAGCNHEQIKAAIEHCVAIVRESQVLTSQLKTGYQPMDVAEWLFNVDHISLTYGIQYEGKDLRLLSPGTKGIVLLILYLAIDRTDSRPLIVDQPDENLDNQSTFEILRPYFREAKKRRQIIMITHNPNLVVNTDADQIIVATSDVQPGGLPYIRYSVGSLEALEADGPLQGSIREEVCRILEGGKEAFRMREQRYLPQLNRK